MKGVGATLKKLRNERPGRRFRETRKEAAAGRGKLGRSVLAILGALVVTVGLFFLAVPGPGILIAAAGLFLVSLASRRTARLLDRGELLLRKLIDRATRQWAAAPMSVRMLLVAAGVLLAASVGYATLRGFGILPG